MLRSKLIKRLAGGHLESSLGTAVSWLQARFLGTHKCPETMQRIKSMRRQVGGPLTNEAFLIHSLAHAQSTLPGDFAEVGVFRGGSARMICDGKGDKRLRLFDTFQGLPEASAADEGVLRARQYACGRDKVEKYLAGYSNLSFHEGLFPDSARGVAEVENARYAFAHFDVDLYEGTRACLEFFYPRMTTGGVMLSHDYSVFAGVRRAFDEFLADKPERAIDLPTTQCMVIKQ